MNVPQNNSTDSFSDKPQNILVIRLGSLGDVVLTSATTLNLRINYPSSHITYLTKSAFKDVAAYLPGVDTIVTLPNSVGLGGLYQLGLELDNRRYDVVIDLHRNLRSRFLTFLLSASQKIAYCKNRAKREALVRFKSGSGAPHTIDAYNAALLGLGPSIEIAATTPQLAPEYYSHCSIRPEIARWRSEGRRVVFVAPGAKHETKRAPLELFADTLKELAARESIGVINAYRNSEGELSLVDSLERGSCLELIDVALPEVTAHLASCDIALSNDSGVAHIASAVGTPVLTLFGPTHPNLGFSPRGVFDTVYETDESCRPCSLHGSILCKRSERFCFSGMSSQALATKLTEMFALQSSLKPALFLDRDGTVIVEKEFLSDPADVELHNGVAEALREAQTAGFRLVIVSNQSGVARGYFPESSVERVNQRVLELLNRAGVAIAGTYYCPNHPAGLVEEYRIRESGRKPADQMFITAARELQIDLRASWVIGDRRSDYLSAAPLGARGALVKTGYGEKAAAQGAISAPLGPEIIAADLPAAIREILAEE